MDYEVLARKWRPQNFKELIGQNSVRTTLINSLKYNRLHPVLLFTGPRGTGKTSVARIFAKTLRCEKKEDFTPCGKCQDCTLIQEGKSLDVIEIDGASHNGVEAVRGLRETIHYMPTTGKYKVYIIDEVHMLSTAAFNALLKTLEEPPKHVFFIMATTEAQKIPVTVVSRTQKLDFYLIPQEALKAHLEKIAKAEKVNIQDEALWLLTKQAQGSLRDGQGLLDQMITFCEGEITEEKIISILGLTERNLLLNTLETIIKGDESQLLKHLHEIYTKGCDSNLFIHDFIELIRNLILLKINPLNNPSLVHASDQEIERLKSLSENLSYEEAHLLFDMSLKGTKDIAFCYDSHLALEVLLLRLSQAPKLEEIVPFYKSENKSHLKDSNHKKAEPKKNLTQKEFSSSQVNSLSPRMKEEPRLETNQSPHKKSSPIESKKTLDPKPIEIKEEPRLETNQSPHKKSSPIESKKTLDPKPIEIKEEPRLETNQSPHKKSSPIESKKTLDPKPIEIKEEPRLETNQSPHKKSSPIESKKTLDPKPIEIKEEPRLETNQSPHKKSSPIESKKTLDPKPIEIKEEPRLETNQSPHKKSSPIESKKTLDPKPIEIKEEPLEADWFRFIDHLKLANPKLSIFVECLSLKEKDQTQFHFILSDKYSFLIDQVLSAKEQIEREFNLFMNTGKNYSITIKETEEKLENLGDKKKAIERKTLFQEVYSDPFVQKVNKVFESQIKSLKVKDRS